MHRVIRHITSVEGRAGPEYRLIEEEFVSDSTVNSSGTMIRSTSAQMVMRLVS